jgi:hypothetical protein
MVQEKKRLRGNLRNIRTFIKDTLSRMKKRKRTYGTVLAISRFLYFISLCCLVSLLQVAAPRSGFMQTISTVFCLTGGAILIIGPALVLSGGGVYVLSTPGTEKEEQETEETNK